MTDDLTERLDEFAIRLLEDAEREGTKAKPGASLTERVGILRAVTAYLDKRAPKAGKADEAGKADQPDENEPTILRLQRQVRRRRG